MDERYIRSGTMHDYNQDRTPGRDYSDTPDYGASRSRYGARNSSSARDYAATGDYGYGRGGYDRGDHGRYDWDGPRGRGASGDYAGSYWDDGRRTTDYDRGRRDDRSRGERERDDRGFLERAGDEVRSWFGDEEAERRREADRRRAAAEDEHYRRWRSSRIAELDRDYDEYRQENAERFDREFGSWRSNRATQRDSLTRVTEHMEVLGSDGEHVGTVDKVRGDRILLTKSDPDADGHHHSIPSRWIDSVDDKVKLTKTAEEAQHHWREESREAAMRWEGEQNRSGDDPRILNRNFSGTY